MCEKCKELVECPIGEKRRVEVAREDKSEITDYYGRKLTIGPWIMFVDKHPDGKIDTGIYQDVYDENSVHYGGGLDITHCPFCGEKFAVIKE
jgi:hypothetical protein